MRSRRAGVAAPAALPPTRPTCSQAVPPSHLNWVIHGLPPSAAQHSMKAIHHPTLCYSCFRICSLSSNTVVDCPSADTHFISWVQERIAISSFSYHWRYSYCSASMDPVTAAGAIGRSGWHACPSMYVRTWSEPQPWLYAELPRQVF
jgi:hypothetical protein